MPRSPLVLAALEQRRRLRQEYELRLLAEVEEASEWCRDVLLNKRGKAAKINPVSLFEGPWARANAYASEELLEYWRSRPRVTFAMFEAEYVEALGWAA